VLDREGGYVLHIGERLGRGVSSTHLSGPHCNGCVRYSFDRDFLLWSAYSHGFPGCLGVRGVGVVIPPVGWDFHGNIAGRCSACRCFLGRAVTFGRVSPVVWGEASDGVGSGDHRTGPRWRVGSGKITFTPTGGSMWH
jgi:hypothetical protein